MNTGVKKLLRRMMMRMSAMNMTVRRRMVLVVVAITMRVMLMVVVYRLNLMIEMTAAQVVARVVREVNDDEGTDLDLRSQFTWWRHVQT